MKNNKGKGASIRLITIVNTILIVCGIIYSINVKLGDVQIAEQENQETQIEIAEVNDNNRETTEVTSRSMTESREKILEELENSNMEETTNEEVKTENNEEEIIEAELEVVYTKIEDVKISQGMDLTVRTGLSREDFISLISGVKADTSGFFEENAGTIYDLCEKYEINEIFFCGLISAESGWNIASNHRRTYNYISLMSNGKLIQFSSVENGLEEAAKALHNKYLTPGGKFYHGKTLSGVKTCFCPASSTWVSLVYGRMKQII